jgi:hypothetical protein
MNESEKLAGAPASSVPAAPQASVARNVLCGALLGPILLLSLTNLCAVAEYRIPQSTLGVVCTQARALLRSPGTKLAFAQGFTKEQMDWRKDVLTLFVVGTQLAAGLILGALVGLILGLVRRGRSEAPPRAPWLPAPLPLGMAVLGMFFQSYVWSVLAVLALARTRRSRWITVATWAIAFLTVVAWSWALDIDWTEGWSKRYHWARELFFPLGHEVGAKE